MGLEAKILGKMVSSMEKFLKDILNRHFTWQITVRFGGVNGLSIAHSKVEARGRNMMMS